MAGHRDFDIVFCRNVLIYFDDASRRVAARASMTCLAAGPLHLPRALGNHEPDFASVQRLPIFRRHRLSKTRGEPWRQSTREASFRNANTHCRRLVAGPALLPQRPGEVRLRGRAGRPTASKPRKRYWQNCSPSDRRRQHAENGWPFPSPHASTRRGRDCGAADLDHFNEVPANKTSRMPGSRGPTFIWSSRFPKPI